MSVRGAGRTSPAEPDSDGLRPYLSNEATEEAINPGKLKRRHLLNRNPCLLQLLSGQGRGQEPESASERMCPPPPPHWPSWTVQGPRPEGLAGMGRSLALGPLRLKGRPLRGAVLLVPAPTSAWAWPQLPLAPAQVLICLPLPEPQPGGSSGCQGTLSLRREVSPDLLPGAPTWFLTPAGRCVWPGPLCRLMPSFPPGGGGPRRPDPAWPQQTPVCAPQQALPLSRGGSSPGLGAGPGGDQAESRFWVGGGGFYLVILSTRTAADRSERCLGDTGSRLEGQRGNSRDWWCGNAPSLLPGHQSLPLAEKQVPRQGREVGHFLGLCLWAACLCNRTSASCTSALAVAPVGSRGRLALPGAL